MGPELTGALGSGVVEAKLAARVPRGLLDRPRLTAALKAGMDGQLTVVTGPAGAGKTALTAAARSVGGAERGYAWLTLDPDDNDPARLWRHLTLALRGCGVPLGDDAQRLTGPADVDTALLTGVAAGIGATDRPTAIVLDNAHCLRPGPALDSLAFLLRQRVPQLALVLCCRALPELPYPRLRVAGELTEIGADDLAFTGVEVTQLLAMHAIAATDVEAEQVRAATGGWPAALALALAGADGQLDRVREQVADGYPPLLAYLRTEVLAEQSAEVRDALLRTSVVEELTPELAAALTGRADAGPLLDRLHEANVLLDRASPGHYRYQPVFRAFLRAQAGTELAAELPALHRRAADWYAGSGDALATARHAVAAGQPATAVTALLTAAPTGLFGNDRPELLTLIDALPPDPAEVPPAGPGSGPGGLAGVPAGSVAALRALAGAARGEAIEIGPLTGHLPAAGPALLPVLRTTDLLVAAHGGDPELVLRQARPLLDDPAGAGTPAACVAWLHLGLAQFWDGALELAGHSLTAAGRDCAPGPVRATALGRRALIAALSGYTGRAEELADEATRVGSTLPVPALATAYVNWLRGAPVNPELLAAARAGSADPRDLALLDCVGEQVDPDHAGGGPLGAGPGPRLVAGWAAVARAGTRLAQGQPAAALALVTSLLRRRGPLDAVSGQARVAAAQARLALGEPAAARSLLSPVHPAPELVGPAVTVAGWLVEALAADRLGAIGTVRVALTAALRAAAPHRLRGPFLAGHGATVTGPDLGRLLLRHAELDAVDPDFLASLPIDPAPTDPPGALIEPVTEREGMVLRYLPSLLTVSDIAAELGVSPNTVKTQLKSLYRKLSVTNRRGAVHRARHLGLL